MALADFAAAWGPGLNVMGNTITQIGLLEYAQKLKKADAALTPSEKAADDKDKKGSKPGSILENPVQEALKVMNKAAPKLTFNEPAGLQFSVPQSLMPQKKLGGYSGF